MWLYQITPRYIRGNCILMRTIDTTASRTVASLSPARNSPSKSAAGREALMSLRDFIAKQWIDVIGMG